MKHMICPVSFGESNCLTKYRRESVTSSSQFVSPKCLECWPLESHVGDPKMCTFCARSSVPSTKLYLNWPKTWVFRVHFWIQKDQNTKILLMFFWLFFTFTFYCILFVFSYIFLKIVWFFVNIFVNYWNLVVQKCSISSHFSIKWLCAMGVLILWSISNCFTFGKFWVVFNL